ncbi:MAG: helix-turn-helix domain-containing protein [Acidimicrobiia bacterium]
MTDEDRLLTAEDLAAFLEVPVKTLYAWRYRGEGPIGFRVGKHIRYRWTDVERWIGDRVRVAESRRSGQIPHRPRVGGSL